MVTQFVNPDNAKKEVHIEAQGRLVGLARKSDATARPGGGHRGVVSGFSAASRRRLLRKIARLQKVKTTFITLTYPKEFPDAQGAKAHLRAFFERIRRRMPWVSGIWRLEFQDRGAPHFHLLMFDMPFVCWRTIKAWWGEIIGVVEGSTLYTRIEAIRSWRGVMSYASKYVAKPTDDIDQPGPDAVALPDGEQSDPEAFFIFNAYLHAGRVWGVFNKDFLPYAAKVYIVIRTETGRGFHDAKKFLRRFYARLTKQRERGGVVFAENAYTIHNAIMRLMLTDVSDFMYRGELIELEG